MHISFASKKLCREMSSESEMRRAYGDRAKRLMMRLGVLKNGASLADVPSSPPERCHPLTGEYEGCFAVDVTGNWRLIFCPDHETVPTNEDGSVNLAAVTHIEIIGVRDYH